MFFSFALGDDGSDAARSRAVPIGLAGVAFVADDGAPLNVGPYVEQGFEATPVDAASPVMSQSIISPPASDFTYVYAHLLVFIGAYLRRIWLCSPPPRPAGSAANEAVPRRLAVSMDPGPLRRGLRARRLDDRRLEQARQRLRLLREAGPDP